MCWKDVLNQPLHLSTMWQFLPFLITRPIKEGTGVAGEDDVKDRRAFDWRRFLEWALAAAIPLAVMWGQMQQKQTGMEKSLDSVLIRMASMEQTLAAAAATNGQYASRADLLELEIRIKDLIREKQ